MSEQNISDNIAKLTERVRLAAQKSQREPSAIQVLAVSKTRPAGDIRTAYQSGMRDFGENYLNESLEKIQALKDLDLRWHFIGPIQSNKTRAIAEHFDWVHSVDRLRIARRLSEQRPPELAALQVCIQVNISNEPSKSGVALTELAELAQGVAALPGITLRGLMAIPAPTQDARQQLAAFLQLQEARDALAQSIAGLDTLSMGMSSDLETAIAAGATIIRIGTDIFGARKT